MGINSKIAKIPFFILYLVLLGLVLFNWIRVILFQKDFEAFITEQPWDYYLSNFFSNTFGITHQQYFIFALPIVLITLCVVPKLIGMLLNLDKKTNIKGDNHVAVIAILLIFPVTFGFQRILDLRWGGNLIPGVIFVILFSLWSWVDERHD